MTTSLATAVAELEREAASAQRLADTYLAMGRSTAAALIKERHKLAAAEAATADLRALVKVLRDDLGEAQVRARLLEIEIERLRGGK